MYPLTGDGVDDDDNYDETLARFRKYSESYASELMG